MRLSSRRDFLTSTAVALGAVPLSGLSRTTWQPRDGGVFRHGVASGDPLADRVMLWTRVTTGRAVADVRWSLATDPAMSRVIARGEGPTAEARDFTVKVDVTGLSPATTYYYRFEAEGGAIPRGADANAAPRQRVAAAPGRRVVLESTRSATSTPTRPWRARADLDAVVHLGDYIYEYANGGFGDGTRTRPGSGARSRRSWRWPIIGSGTRNTKPIPISQEVHRQHPFIVVWDDHELTNNAWWGGAENHDPDPRRRRLVRAARRRGQAFFEWMPIREDAQALSPRIYRTLKFGDLADLILLDTRLVGRDEQVGHATTLPRSNAPSRSLLGPAQEGWLHGELMESKRGRTRWQILGQQVMFAPQTPQSRQRRQSRFVGRLSRQPRPCLRHGRASEGARTSPS